MMKKSVFLAILAASLLVTGNASAYEFWGVTVGTAEHEGATQLTFDGLAGSGIQYAVGGYEYTRVDSDWQGPFPAAAPGEGYLASRKSDAQGLFFKFDANYAKFVVITGSAQTGAPAPELGTGTRLFGPGDLTIDVGGDTYGVGLRLSGLDWAIDPATTNPEHLIYHPDGSVASIYARDVGTAGDIELNPTWARAGHSTLPIGSEMAPAFFVSGSGDQAGSANVTYEDTGIVMYGAEVYAYELEVPWTALNVDPENFDILISYGPDCGNDIIKVDFSSNFGPGPVPEPGSWVVVLSGLAGLGALVKRK